MLVLSRKESQTIVIGAGIEVTVTAIQGGRVKIGINAPQHVSIRRSELAASPGEPKVLAAPTNDVAEVEPQLSLAYGGRHAH